MRNLPQRALNQIHKSKPIIRGIMAPLLSIMIFTLGNGYFLPFISLRVKEFGYSTEVVGFMTSVFFIGLSLGCYVQKRFIEKQGRRRAYICFSILDVIIITLLALTKNIYLWLILRFLGGICVSAILISVESWFLYSSSIKNKGKIFSLYKTSAYIILGFSQYFLTLGHIKGYLHFVIIGSLIFVAIIPLLFAKNNEPPTNKKSSLTLKELKKRSNLGLIGGLIAGGVLGSIYGLLPIYIKDLGYGLEEISKVMRLALFGNLFFQIPIGYFSDKFDRKKVALFSSLLSFCTCLLIASFNTPDTSFYILILIFGGLSFIIYPLSISITSDSVEGKDTVAAAGFVLLAYSIGAIIGPILASFAMNIISIKSLFIYFAILNILLALASLRSIQNQATSKDACSFFKTNNL
jgi:MFS family permease